MKRIILAGFSIVLLLPLALRAQEQISGTFATSDLTLDTLVLSEDRVVTRGVNGILVDADDPSNPFSGQNGQCLGKTVAAQEAILVISGGACFAENAEGDGYWWWWRVTEAGTEECPMECGTWSIFLGFGRFEGATGGGTYRATAQNADGTGSGEWQGTIKW
jgi:hypothetical protein